MDNLIERFQAIIRLNTPEKRRWSELEALTNIPATSWNKAFNEKQRPTAEMIQAIARLWPEYAFWLSTGVTDAKHGHVSCRDGVIAKFYPERTYAPRNAARPYFLQLIDLFGRTYGKAHQFASESLEKEALVNLAQLEVARDAEEQAMTGIERESALEGLKRARDALAAAELSDPE